MFRFSIKRLLTISVLLATALTLSACQSAPDENGARLEISYNPSMLRPFPDDASMPIRHSGPIDVEWYDEALAKAHREFVAGGSRSADKPGILLEAERHLRRALNQPVRFGMSGHRLWVEPRGLDVNYRLVAEAFAGTGLFKRVQVGHLSYQ